MASKRDQLQAYQFLVQRTISALVMRESDPEQPPFRRPSTAGLGSIAIAVVALVAVGIYGVLVPGGNDAWRDGEAVIVVEETGTRYVFIDGRLHPVLNYASALLALGQHAETRSVSRNSLAGVPRGPRIGIPDAPDALPGPDRVVRAGWSLCSRPATDATGSTVDESVLLVGAEPSGGRRLGDTAVLVEVPGTGDQYLIWRGHRHRIAEPDTVAVGLALRSEPRVRVGQAFVDAVPAGEAIASIPLPEAGAESTAVPRRPDLRAGQLLVAQTPGGGVQHYLVLTDRLRAISALQYAIQLAYPPTATAYGDAEPAGIRLGLVSAAEARLEPAPPPAPGAAPPRRPALAGSGAGDEPVCATFEPGRFVPRLQVGGGLPPVELTTVTPRRTPGGAPLADRVYVRPGWAAVVEAIPSPQAPAGTFIVVTDQGRGHTLATADLLDVLGYGAVTPVRLPAGLVARLPMGSGLDPDAAMAAA